MSAKLTGAKAEGGMEWRDGGGGVLCVVGKRVAGKTGG